MARRNKYTPAQIGFIRRSYRRMTLRDLVPLFNRKFKTSLSESALHTVIGRHGITCGRAHHERLAPLRLVTAEQARFIREMYPLMNRARLTEELCKVFGPVLSKRQIEYFIRNHHVSSKGRTGRFQKGQAAWNKGLKGFMGRNATSFKKGNLPHNYKPLGFERVSVDGYVEIKVAERNPHTGFPERFRFKHVVIWEKHHGRRVPKGSVIVFADGDRRNFDPENLVCLTRAELARMNQNGYGKLPAELKPFFITLMRLKAKTFEKMRRST